MSDITKCEGKGCDLRENCWRYRAIPTPFQSWAGFYTEQKPCKHYYPIVPEAA